MMQAYEICIRRGLIKEQVFILGRMGNSRKALALIINKLEDMEQVGLCFCEPLSFICTKYCGN